jgi:hypothetical protein
MSRKTSTFRFATGFQSVFPFFCHVCRLFKDIFVLKCPRGKLIFCNVVFRSGTNIILAVKKIPLKETQQFFSLAVLLIRSASLRGPSVASHISFADE